MKIKCKICECEFNPIREKHYISKEGAKTGLIAVIQSEEEKLYDTFDCPECGCQVIAQERKQVVSCLFGCEEVPPTYVGFIDDINEQE